MRKILLTLILCALSFGAGAYLTGTHAASAIEDPVFEGDVTAGYAVIQNGVTYQTLDNNDDPAATVSVTVSLASSTFGGVEGGRLYKLVLIPGDER
ncbi:MAG TPA: hypothetical protein VGC91_16065 [Pyrinomonadaceae bacterium]